MLATDSADSLKPEDRGVSAKPSLAYMKSHVVRLAGGVACPNCNRRLRAIDAIVDFGAVSVVLRCWGCHADVLRVERRD